LARLRVGLELLLLVVRLDRGANAQNGRGEQRTPEPQDGFPHVFRPPSLVDIAPGWLKLAHPGWLVEGDWSTSAGGKKGRLGDGCSGFIHSSLRGAGRANSSDRRGVATGAGWRGSKAVAPSATMDGDAGPAPARFGRTDEHSRPARRHHPHVSEVR